MHANSFDGGRKSVPVKGTDVLIDFWVGYQAMGVRAG